MSNIFIGKNVPASSNLVWKNIILGKVNINLNFLAGKILLSRLKMVIAREGEKAETVETCVTQIRELYLKRGHLPDAQKDLVLINQVAI